MAARRESQIGIAVLVAQIGQVQASTEVHVVAIAACPMVVVFWLADHCGCFDGSRLLLPRGSWRSPGAGASRALHVVAELIDASFIATRGWPLRSRPGGLCNPAGPAGFCKGITASPLRFAFCRNVALLPRQSALGRGAPGRIECLNSLRSLIVRA